MPLTTEDPAVIAQALMKTYVLLAGLMLASPWLVIAGTYLSD